MNNIVESAAAANQFKTLVTAVQAAGLADTLQGTGPFIAVFGISFVSIFMAVIARNPDNKK